MKSIKYFKYINKKCFNVFLKEYGYSLDDVIGYKFGGRKQYRGNILKTYIIFFKDEEVEYFNVVCFKSFNEYQQTRLGFNNNRLLEGYEYANVKAYKVCNEIIYC